MWVLRKIVALLLLFVMMFCIGKNSALYTFYTLNADAFVSFFCENIERPELKCNGKCQLAKMAKEEQAEKVLSSLQKEVFLFHQYSVAENFSLYFTERFLTVSVLSPKNNYSYLYFFRDDKPPQFLS